MRVVKVPPDEWRITVEFTREDAEVLRTVCGAIGGDTCGPRRVTDELLAILRDAGIKAKALMIDEDNTSRGCMFLRKC